jgi:hypothetical protein
VANIQIKSGKTTTFGIFLPIMAVFPDFQVEIIVIRTNLWHQAE